MLTLNAKGVVWDLDGTLLDSFGQFVEVLTEVLTRRGIAVPQYDVFLRHYHGSLRDSIQGVCGADGRLLDELCHDFMRTDERHYEHPGDLLYFPDALDLLQRNHAAGLKQIIISNRAHHSDDRLASPRNLAKREPLAGFVEFAVCGDDNEFHKPDARVVDEAERVLGLSRSELVVVGDQFVDAELAHNLGVPAVLITRDGVEIPHLDKLAGGWEDRVHIVNDLRDVSIAVQQASSLAGNLDN